MNPTETCPINLDYDEPAGPVLDLAATVRQGSRLRRRRQLVQGAAAVAAVTGVTASVLALRAPQAVSPAAGSNYAPISAYLAAHPPVGGAPTVIDTWPTPWTTAAWLTADGQFCHAAFRSPSAGTIAIEDCTGEGPAGTVIGMPIPLVGPMEQHQTYGRAGNAADLSPAIGLVRGPVTKIEMTIFGHTFTADVTPIGSDGTTQIGAYQVWFEHAGASAYGPADIQDFTAYNAAGKIVAAHGPWIASAK